MVTEDVPTLDGSFVDRCEEILDENFVVGWKNPGERKPGSGGETWSSAGTMFLTPCLWFLGVDPETKEKSCSQTYDDGAKYEHR